MMGWIQEKTVEIAKRLISTNAILGKE